jgi:hypothetical protein
MRSSIKRVGTGLQRVMTPRTPHKMTFSPVLEKRNRNGSAAVLLDDRDDPKKSMGSERGRSDREKGLETVNEEGRSGSQSSGEGHKGGKNGRRPAPPPVTVPQSKFEMDSPKTPLWSKVFGR